MLYLPPPIRRGEMILALFYWPPSPCSTAVGQLAVVVERLEKQAKTRMIPVGQAARLPRAEGRRAACPTDPLSAWRKSGNSGRGSSLDVRAHPGRDGRFVAEPAATDPLPKPPAVAAQKKVFVTVAPVGRDDGDAP